MNDSFDAKQMDEILAKHGRQASNIIAILQDVQETYRYLPREIFPYLSKELGMTTANIYSVATFYENFSLEPKGKYAVSYTHLDVYKRQVFHRRADRGCKIWQHCHYR